MTTAVIGRSRPANSRVNLTSPFKARIVLSAPRAEWPVGWTTIPAFIKNDRSTTDDVAPVSTTM